MRNYSDNWLIASYILKVKMPNTTSFFAIYCDRFFFFYFFWHLTDQTIVKICKLLIVNINLQIILNENNL